MLIVRIKASASITTAVPPQYLFAVLGAVDDAVRCKLHFLRRCRASRVPSCSKVGVRPSFMPSALDRLTHALKHSLVESACYVPWAGIIRR